MMKTPEQYRVKEGQLASTYLDENNGCFVIPFRNYEFIVIASDGDDWEHVSVSLKNRPPNWEEMCFIKDLFWDEEDCVIQYHPPKSEYINNMNTCLHMWKPVGKEILRPPKILVGI